MAYYQDPFFLDYQFQDEIYFTNFHSDDDDQKVHVIKCSKPRPMLIETQYNIPSNSFDNGFVSLYLDSLESPFVDTVGPSQLCSNSSQLPLECQPSQSPETGLLDSQNGSMDISPLSSLSRADAETGRIIPRFPRKKRTTHSSEPQPKKGRSRKKRNTSSASGEIESAILEAKYAHSVVERRYRDNLSSKMMQLHQVLLTAETSQASLCNTTQSTAQNPAGRVRKSDIMTRGVDYVHQSEVEIRHLNDEVQRLQKQVRMCQAC